jgi:hypothetical protein
MQKIKDYLTNPATRISFIVFVFWIWAVWANTNSRIDILEQKVNKIDQIWIETQLAELKIDMQWIKTTLEEIKRAM